MAGSTEWIRPNFLLLIKFPFLPLLDPLDRQPHLLFELIVGIVVEVGDARVHADDRLHGGERILPRRGGVIDERFRDLDVLGKARHQIDVPLAVAIDRRTQFQVLGDRLLELFVPVWACSPSTASRSLRERVSRMQGVMVRTVTSDGLSETRSVSPKNSPSVSRAIRRSLPWAPLLSTSTCPWAIMMNLLEVLPLDDQLVSQRYFLAS